MRGEQAKRTRGSKKKEQDWVREKRNREGIEIYLCAKLRREFVKKDYNFHRLKALLKKIGLSNAMF